MSASPLCAKMLFPTLNPTPLPVIIMFGNPYGCSPCASNIYVSPQQQCVHKNLNQQGCQTLEHPFEKDKHATRPPFTSNLGSDNYGMTCL